MSLDNFSAGPREGVDKLNALVDALRAGLIAPSEDFSIETDPAGRQLLRLRANLAKPSPPPAPNDCDECDGLTVWTDNNPPHTGTPIVCKSVDTVITLPFCAYSWTWHFEANSSADRFTVNGVEYYGCTPLFGSPLPNGNGTVLVSVSGRELHIVVECSCATPPVRNSTWSAYIICNVSP